MSVLELANKERENIIHKKYEEACEELKALIRENPFQTSFDIRAGCDSEKLTKEIAKRFNNGKATAVACDEGRLSSKWVLKVEIPLPNNLEKKEEKEEKEEEKEA